jgi:hypothetical protein
MRRGASGNLQPDFIAEVIAVLYGEVCTSATDMIVTDAARPVQAVALVLRADALPEGAFSRRHLRGT